MYRKVFELGQGLRDWTVPEKIQTGGRVRIYNFQEYSRNYMQNFQGLIKNKVKFPRETKKDSCEISRGLDFLTLKSPRDVTYIILPNFQGWSFVLSEISRDTEKNKKNPGIFSKKVCPETPLFVCFSGIAHCKTIDLN